MLFDSKTEYCQNYPQIMIFCFLPKNLNIAKIVSKYCFFCNIARIIHNVFHSETEYCQNYRQIFFLFKNWIFPKLYALFYKKKWLLTKISTNHAIYFIIFYQINGILPKLSANIVFHSKTKYCQNYPQIMLITIFVNIVYCPNYLPIVLFFTQKLNIAKIICIFFLLKNDCQNYPQIMLITIFVNIVYCPNYLPIVLFFTQKLRCISSNQ